MLRAQGTGTSANGATGTAGGDLSGSYPNPALASPIAHAQTFQFNGSSSNAQAASILRAQTAASPPSGNFAAISIAKQGTQELLIGINKNSTTGSVPGNGAFIATYNNSGTITIGRGNSAGSPDKADIAIASDGAVTFGDNPISRFSAAINLQTGTSYTLQASDNGKVVELGNAAAITLTVPSGLGNGFNCTIVQTGAGQVTLSASGTTLRHRNSHSKIAGQWGIATLYHRGSNEFVLAGDTAI